jgi:hypothetical protein
VACSRNGGCKSSLEDLDITTETEDAVARTVKTQSVLDTSWKTTWRNVATMRLGGLAVTCRLACVSKTPSHNFSLTLGLDVLSVAIR